MSSATSSDDFGAELAILLRSYTDAVGPKLGDFPQGQRGYQTLCEVVRGEPPSQAVLAARLGIDRTMMTYLIDDLVEAGLVERRPNPDDRRQRRVVATDHGRKAIATLCGQVAEAETTALAGLTEQERTVFRQLLGKATGGAQADACELVDEALRS